MNKIISVSKKTLSVVLAMLMAFSVMATAFAEGETPKLEAPADFNIAAVFSDTIVVEAIKGAEYAILPYADEVAPDPATAEYRAEAVFTGLTAETSYSVLVRLAATDAALASDPVIKACSTGAADSDPAVEIADADIAVNHSLRNIVCAPKAVEYNGASYIVKYEISPNAGVDISSLADGSVKFGNLNAGATYSITAKITVAGIDFASAPVNKTLKMSQNSPATPVPVKVTATSIEIKVADKSAVYAIAAKGSAEELVWASKNVFENLEPETEYVIYVKLPETDTYLESAYAFIETSTLIASAGKAPAPVLKNKNNTSIEVKAADSKATEFSIDGGKTWNKTGIFTDLKANQNYSIIARYVFDEIKQDPSVNSDAVSIITNKRANYEAAISNCSFTVTTDGKVYAKSSFNFTAKGDTYSDVDQYGDTRLVPVAWAYADQSGDTNVYNITYTGTVYTPDTAQDITVTITYLLQKYNGSNWETVNEVEEGYIVHVSPEYNAIKAFFEGLLNVLLNFIPKLIVELINRFA